MRTQIVMVVTVQQTQKGEQERKVTRLDLSDENAILDWLLETARSGKVLVGCYGKVRKSWKDRIRSAAKKAVKSLADMERASGLREAIIATAEALREHIKGAESSTGKAAEMTALAVAWENGKRDDPPGTWIDPASYPKVIQDTYRDLLERQLMKLISENLDGEMDMAYWVYGDK